jgi:hypothetical protein
MRNKYIDPLKVKDIKDYSPQEQIILHVTYVRMDLYNKGKKCGPAAIQKEMLNMEIDKIPSTAAISRILRDQYLTNGRTGYYPGDPP